MKPSQNTGTETPSSIALMVSTSSAEERRTAAMMPAGTPMTIANASAAAESSTVAGKYWASFVETGCASTSDRPRSPCRTAAT
jgi:hypothetical protein